MRSRTWTRHVGWVALIVLGTVALAGCGGSPTDGPVADASVAKVESPASPERPVADQASADAQTGAEKGPADSQPARQPADATPSPKPPAEESPTAEPQQTDEVPMHSEGQQPQLTALQLDEAKVDRLLPLRSRKIPAPSLEGGVDWLNTAGPIDLRDLRGKFVLLDFWTYCCINCMHVLPELKKLEKKYPNQLVVIGVHSKKFDGEEDTENIRQAILRYEIEHPVVNDANHTIWERFYVNSWPTLVLIDPEGHVVWFRPGEIQAEQLIEVLDTAIPFYRKQRLLDETPVHFDLESYQASRTPLRYPGKILADEAGGRLFITDSNHNRIVITDLDGKLQQIIGSGAIGRDDGDFAKATFDHPQGVVLHGDRLYIADTENHLIRRADLDTQRVTTVAGTGQQSRNPWAELNPETLLGPPKKIALNSPWALWVHGKWAYIAMAGPHQIWRLNLDETQIGPYAGTGAEDIIDGALLTLEKPADVPYATFAQPSGLASDGKVMYVADSEGSSVRAVPFDYTGLVTTVVGTAHLPQARLFTFGDVDGALRDARLQHPIDVLYHRGLLYVADTYNNKIKSIDLEKQQIRTVAGTGEEGADDEAPTFDEPAGLAAAGDLLYVADTNNHVIRVIDLADKARVRTLEIAGLEPPPRPEVQPVAAVPGKPVLVKTPPLQPQQGKIRLEVKLRLPEGFKMNPLAPMRYKLELLDPQGPIDREAVQPGVVKLDQPADAFQISLPVRGEGKETIRVSLTYYYCKDGAEGICKVGSVAWNVPLEVAASGQTEAPLLQAAVQ